jgi:hypothetical protein
MNGITRITSRVIKTTMARKAGIIAVVNISDMAGAKSTATVTGMADTGTGHVLTLVLVGFFSFPICPGNR